MDEHTYKQRIVGAIVLVALAVIFVPMLLSGHRDRIFRDTEEVIPQKPTNLENLSVLELQNPIPAPVPPTTLRTPIDEKSPVEAKSSQEQTVEKESQTTQPRSVAKAAPLSQKSNVAPTTKAWAVQVGSFGQRDNAMRLRDKLRKNGYLAFVEKLTTQNRTVYRVRVGPEVRREKAEKLQKNIQAKMKLKGIVVSHP